MAIVTKEGNLQEYLNEERLYLFEPNSIGAFCWTSMEEVPDRTKAKTFHFEMVRKTECYMTPVRKDGREYAKIYIVGANNNITILYTEKHAVYQGARVYRK